MNRMMQAAVAERAGEGLALREVPVPEPGADEILVRIRACGVCYTDLRIIDGMGTALMPLVPGHEPVGVVEALGAGVDGFAPGDRVGVHALFTCGTCAYCLAGEEEACVTGIQALAGLGRSGGYSEYMIVPAAHAVPLPAELSFAEAAPFLCAGLTTFAGLKNGGLEPGQRVVVVGIGGLGHLAIPIARAMGAEVYAVTGTPEKSELARTLGATSAGSASQIASELSALGGAHQLLNTANSLSPLPELLPAMARQSAIVLTSADSETLPIPPSTLMGLQMRVIGSFFGSRQDLVDVLDLAARHDIRPIVERYPLADVATAHARLRDNLVRYRAVLEL